ncbi:MULTISPECIES: hypothetical protein [unclassified Butyrivibrio]|jgi:hypothetical protein|uniref:hypothetical protein n=1 Tax=unclassified Butyrivibrio TaxID=2639466 RepID=UPI000409C187|nr:MULTISPECIES: hypothetical protein [unclassified Butyrivibrio]
MSRLSEVTALYQQRTKEVENRLANSPDDSKVEAFMQIMVGTLNDISQTLAIIADENAKNK